MVHLSYASYAKVPYILTSDLRAGLAGTRPSPALQFSIYVGSFFCYFLSQPWPFSPFTLSLLNSSKFCDFWVCHSEFSGSEAFCSCTAARISETIRPTLWPSNNGPKTRENHQSRAFLLISKSDHIFYILYYTNDKLYNQNAKEWHINSV